MSDRSTALAQSAGSPGRDSWPRPRRRIIGAVNWRGTWSLFCRELWRALKVWDFTLGSATIRAVLFTAVFGFATAGIERPMGGMPLIDFLIPGLIAAAVLEHAFVSAAFSIVHDRIEGILGDTLMAPLTVAEIIGVYIAAAVVGTLVVGTVVWAALLPFGAPLPVHTGAVVGFAAAGAVLVGFVSTMVGLWVRRWDSLAAVQTFVVLPFVFTSGVFFSLDRLPASLTVVARANPLFYVVDGIRFGLTGRAESDPMTGIAIIAATTAVLGALCYLMFSRGTGLRD
jgi:ABC-2 type transport system permease protein